jgi:hypothetical protein
LATGDLAEDMKLGTDLTCAGHPPVFCEQAVVTSYYPASEEGAIGQRRRWEHGHLGIIIRDALRLFLKALRLFDAALLAVTLDLIVPPLSLLSLIIVSMSLAGAAFAVFAGPKLPLEISITSALLMALAVMIAWIRYGRSTLSLRDLLLIPVYALWKVPLYASFVVSRQMDWVRSKRD